MWKHIYSGKIISAAEYTELDEYEKNYYRPHISDKEPYRSSSSSNDDTVNGIIDGLASWLDTDSSSSSRSSDSGDSFGGFDSGDFGGGGAGGDW